MDNVFLLIFSLTALGILLVVIYLYVRWGKLKKELFPETAPVLEDKTPSKDKPIQNRRWLDNIHSILERVQGVVEKDPAAGSSTKQFQKLTDSSKFNEIVKSVIIRSLTSAELQTVLVKNGDLYAYVAVFPNRHEYPHLIRRYPSFSSGWVYHNSVIRKSLPSNGGPPASVGYLFFLSPDSKEGIVLASYADAKRELVPEALVYEAELQVPNVKSWTVSCNFSMAGE